MLKKGKFIVFEGLDGCGTTTQTTLLSAYFAQKKINHLLTCEPTNNIIGGLVRGVLTKQWKTSPSGLQLLFCADRAHHLEFEILPALKKGIHVICDRYSFSTMAFGSLNCDSWWLTQLNKDFLEPDLILYIKAPAKVCLTRIKKRSLNTELFEEEKKLVKVEEMYDFLAQKHKNTITINGNQNQETVFDLVLSEIQKII
jgi:dTMP kinase